MVERGRASSFDASDRAIRDVAAVATFGRKPGAVVAGVSTMVAALLISASPPPRGAWGLP